MSPQTSRVTKDMSAGIDPAIRILVIDDDSHVGSAIRAILTPQHCETVLTSRARSGLRAFRSGDFDVVIVDLFMPGMTGLEAISRIRYESQVPIIAISGFIPPDRLDPSMDFLGLAAEYGATVCLRKPFGRPQLENAIHRSLAMVPAPGTQLQ